MYPVEGKFLNSIELLCAGDSLRRETTLLFDSSGKYLQGRSVDEADILLTQSYLDDVQGIIDRFNSSLSTFSNSQAARSMNKNDIKELNASLENSLKQLHTVNERVKNYLNNSRQLCSASVDASDEKKLATIMTQSDQVILSILNISAAINKLGNNHIATQPASSRRLSDSSISTSSTPSTSLNEIPKKTFELKDGKKPIVRKARSMSDPEKLRAHSLASSSSSSSSSGSSSPVEGTSQPTATRSRKIELALSLPEPTPITDKFNKLISIFKGRENCFTTVGIFRQSGSKTVLNAAIEQFNENWTVDDGVDLLIITDLIKKSINSTELPKDFVLRMVEIGNDTKLSEADKLIQIKNCFTEQLSDDQASYLNTLMEFFDEVASHSEKNKMPADNLILMLAPNVLPSPDETPMSELISHNDGATNAFRLMFNQFRNDKDYFSYKAKFES